MAICRLLPVCPVRETMTSDGFLVVLNILFFLVVRPKESLDLLQGMGVPLQQNWGEGWVAKEISVYTFVGGATKANQGGRPTLEKRGVKWEFDSTKGFPGEDGLQV